MPISKETSKRNRRSNFGEVRCRTGLTESRIRGTAPIQTIGASGIRSRKTVTRATTYGNSTVKRLLSTLAHPRLSEAAKGCGEYAQAILFGFILGHPASEVVFTSFLTEKYARLSRHVRAAIEGFHWMLKQCAERGPKPFFASLRNFGMIRSASALTRHWGFRGAFSLKGLAEEKGRGLIFQITRAGRCGPYPSFEKTEETLLMQKSDVTRTWKPEGRDVVYARRFAEKWATNRVSSVGGVVRVNNSAASTWAFSKGGLQACAKSIADAFRATPLAWDEITKLDEQVKTILGDWKCLSSKTHGCFLRFHESLQCGRMHGTSIGVKVNAEYSLFLWEDYYALPPFNFQLCQWEVHREMLFLVAACVYNIESGKAPLICTRSTIAEKSEKVRVVTPCSPEYAILGSLVNSFLLDTMSSDKRLTTREDSPADYIEEWRAGRELTKAVASDHKFVLRSADLVRASDLVPIEIATAIAEGILAAWGKPKDSFLGKLILQLVGPVRITKSEASSAEFWTTSGILMGLGATWPILSIYNLSCWEKSWTKSGLRKIFSERTRSCVKICGDDLIAYAPKVVSDGFTREIEATGGKINAVKDIESTNAGCFVEELILPVWTMVGGVRFKVVRTRSLSVLSEKPKVQGNPRAPLWCRASTLYTAPHSKADLRVLHALLAKQIAMVKRYGIDPFLPRIFGGAGFPASRQVVMHSVSKLTPQWARALRCVLAQKPLDLIRHLGQLKSCWEFNQQWGPSRFFALTIADDCLDSWLKTKEVKVSDNVKSSLFTGLRPSSGFVSTAVDGRTLIDHYMYICGSVALACCLCGGFPSVTEGKASLKAVKGRLDEWVRNANDLIPDRSRLSDPVRNIWKGVYDRINLLEKQRWPLDQLPWMESRTIGGLTVETAGV